MSTLIDSARSAVYQDGMIVVMMDSGGERDWVWTFRMIRNSLAVLPPPKPMVEPRG